MNYTTTDTVVTLSMILLDMLIAMIVFMPYVAWYMDRKYLRRFYGLHQSV